MDHQRALPLGNAALCLFRYTQSECLRGNPWCKPLHCRAYDHLFASTQTQQPHVHFLTSSLPCLTQILISGLFPLRYLDCPMHPTLYPSALIVILARCCLSHTQSQRGCAVFWDSPFGLVMQKLVGEQIPRCPQCVWNKSRLQPLLSRTLGKCLPYSSFRITGKELPHWWVTVHPHLYPDDACCLWLLAQGGPRMEKPHL